MGDKKTVKTMKRSPLEKFDAYRERIKKEAKRIKDYLKGRIIAGTETVYSPDYRVQGTRSFSR